YTSADDCPDACGSSNLTRVPEDAMISTFVNTARVRAPKRFSPRACAIAASIVLLAGGGRNALAQSNPTSGGFLEHDALTPPLLFREVWQQPPHTGPLNDENRRITSDALTNKDLTLQIYGPDARQLPVTSHNGIPDLWN